MISDEEIEELRAQGFKVTAPGGRNLTPVPDRNGHSFEKTVVPIVEKISESIESLAKGKQSEEWKFEIRDSNGKLTKTITAKRQ